MLTGKPSFLRPKYHLDPRYLTTVINKVVKFVNDVVRILLTTVVKHFSTMLLKICYLLLKIDNVVKITLTTVVKDLFKNVVKGFVNTLNIIYQLKSFVRSY